MPPKTVQRYLTDKTVSPRMVWRFNHTTRSMPAGKMLETLAPVAILCLKDNTSNSVFTGQLPIPLFKSGLCRSLADE